VETVRAHKSGDLVSVEPALRAAAGGRVQGGYVYTFRDIGERNADGKKFGARRDARRSDGLANRALFMDRLNLALARRAAAEPELRVLFWIWTASGDQRRIGHARGCGF